MTGTAATGQPSALKEIKGGASAQTKPLEEVPLEHSFHVRYVTRRGKVYEGEFLNRILNIGEIQRMGLARAQRISGAAIESVAPITFELAHMVAWMNLSLKQRPGWANDFDSLFDVDLLQAVYQEVAAHEARFRGPSEDPV